MATEKILNTRIQLKYDSYINWETNNPTLKPGEVAIAYLALSNTATTPDNNTHPVMFKVGPGEFNSLPWASALAADVHAWAKKSEEDFTTWVKGLIDVSDIDAYSKTEADNLLAGKVDNSAFDTYKTTNDAAVKKVADDLAAEAEAARAAEKANADAIAAMKDHASVDSFADVMAEIAKKQDTIPANTYDAYGTAAQTLADANAYTDERVNDMGEEVGELENAIAELIGEVPEGSNVVKMILDAHQLTITADNKIRESVSANTSDIDALKESLAEGGATANAIAAAQKAGDDAQDAVDALAAKVGEVLEDKTVVQMIADAQAAATYDDTKVKEDIAANADAIKAISDDYLKAADKTELEGKIKTNTDAIELLTNGVSAEEVDGVNDLIQYVKEHGTEVTGIKADITAANADIEALQTKVDTGDKTVTGYVTDVIASLKLEETVGAFNMLFEAFDGRISTNHQDIVKLGDSIEALGDMAKKDVVSETDLDSALAEKINASAQANHSHSNKAELDKFVDGDKAKLDSAVQTVTAAADSGLKATRTGNDIAIEIDPNVVFVFNCGTASTLID